MKNTAQPKAQHSVLHITILVVAVLLAYSKIFNAGFMSWDDADYVLQNNDIKAFSWEHISNWFSHFYIGNYHPLTMFSYAIDFLIGKEEPWIYHTTNILLHCANAVLVYLFLNALQNNKAIAWIVALLFAIHPVQTESVSWIAERKNVLYGFFFLLSLLSYAKYLLNKKAEQLIILLFAGIAAMLCKPAAVVLPVALIAVDVWMQKPLRSTIVIKVGLLIAALILGYIAIHAQQQDALLNLHPEYKWYHTIVFAGYAYTQYIVQLIFPAKLSVLYPYPREIGFIHILFLAISICVLALAVIAYRKKRFVLCGGILFYTINIVIVLQFVQFGEVLMADRYLYIVSIGIWFPLVWYLFLLAKQRTATVAGLALSVLFLMGTYMHNDIWLSEMNFWQAILDKFPNSSVAQNSMGGIYLRTGDYPRALQHIDEAIQLDERNYKAWYNKGVAEFRSGDVQHAVQSLDHCIAINEYTKALFTRALLYQQVGQPLRAMSDVDKVLEKEPENARAYFIKGDCLEQQNNLQSAFNCYNKAVAYDEAEPLFYMKRGIVSAKLGQHAEALNDLTIAIDRKPALTAAWYWRGMTKYKLKQQPCSDLNEAARRGSKEAADAMQQFCK